MGRTVTLDDRSVTVANPRVRKAVVSRGAHARVVAGAGQYVEVDVTVDGTALDDADRGGDLALRAVANGSPVPDGDALPTVESGRFAVPFPAERHDVASIRWTTGESAVDWVLPAAVRERLAAEPAFRVADLAVPREDGDLGLEMPVANDGDRDGRFVARVSFEAFSGGAVVSLDVPAGETRRYSGRPGSVLLYLDNSGGGTLTVEYPGVDGLRQVEHGVPASGTATGAEG